MWRVTIHRPTLGPSSLASYLLNEEIQGGLATTMEKTRHFCEKRNLFLEMKGLAERQREAVVEERMNLYFDLTAHRKALQQKISAHEPPAGTPAHGSPVDPGDGRPHSLANEVAQIIQSIQEIDRQIGAFVTEKKAALLQEIRGMRKGQQALRGYGGMSTRNPRFIDKKG